jgi:hypothetical protein
MRVYNRYILTVVILLLLTTVILVACNVDSLEVYCVVYILETLIATELYGYFNTRTRSGLHRVSGLLFLGFIIIVLVRVAKIIAPG